MNKLPDKSGKKSITAFAVFLFCVLATILASYVSYRVQSDGGKIIVSDVTFFSQNGTPIRAKLFKPLTAKNETPAPGVVFVHGYQSNRETGDPICIELARRGFVSLAIDTTGRGNSGLPGKLSDPDFDNTFGALAAVKYLKNLPFVKKNSIGMIGHSLGGRMSFDVATNKKDVKSLVIIGYGYPGSVTFTNPPDMLMIIGKWDEFRTRMTGTNNIEKQWMSTKRTLSAIDAANPVAGKTYGDFSLGTARRVIIPRTTHILETHNTLSIAETLNWMQKSLLPDRAHWIDPYSQVWHTKPVATLLAMLFGLAGIIPLFYLLTKTSYFSPLARKTKRTNTVSNTSRRQIIKAYLINGILMMSYLPLILILFGIHKYVVPVDPVFPMMVVNTIVFWFVAIGVAGYFIFKKMKNTSSEISGNIYIIQSQEIVRVLLLGITLFSYVCLLEYVLEKVFITDFRYVFAFASDIPLNRLCNFFIYLPLFAVGFYLQGMFIHCQIILSPKSSFAKTFIYHTTSNILILVTPLLFHLALQYVPLFINGVIPFEGPGGIFVLSMINVFHLTGVLIMVIPISTFIFLFTGRPHLGAFVNSLIVTWMLVSSQVIAPVPV